MNLFERLKNWLHPEVAKEIADLEARIKVLEEAVLARINPTPPAAQPTPGVQS